MKKILLIAGLLIAGSQISAEWWNPFKRESAEETLNQALTAIEGRVAFLYASDQLKVEPETTKMEIASMLFNFISLTMSLRVATDLTDEIKSKALTRLYRIQKVLEEI